MAYSGVGTNPKHCPECSAELTSRNWRAHLKQKHGWEYSVSLPSHPQRNHLFPRRIVFDVLTGIHYKPVKGSEQNG